MRRRPDREGERLLVMETDTRAGGHAYGEETVATLVGANGPLPETRKARSPSGSVHYWFIGSTTTATRSRTPSAPPIATEYSTGSATGSTCEPAAVW